MDAATKPSQAAEVEASSAVDRLIAAIQELSLAEDLEAIIEIVRRTARDLAGAHGATFVLRDGDLCHYVDEDAIGPLWKGQRFPLESCISGWVMLNRKAAAVEDIYADPRIPADAYRPTFVKSLVMVPIRTAGPLGAIGNYWATPHTATDDDVRYLQALADATAVAMERVRLHHELEQRVRERTSELEAANRRLAAEIEERRQAQESLQSSEQQARRMRAERDQLASVLASGIAHELNQPLTAAITYVNTALRLLRGECGDSEQAIEVMEKATAQNWRAANVVRQFRELLQRGEPDLRAADLAEVVRSAAEVVQEQASELGFALGLDVGEDLGWVQCDGSQIEHVLLNLIRNGLEAMRDVGKARGAVRVRVRPGRPGFVQVSVADDGTGLSPEAREKLFTSFHSTKSDGLGLGLSVSRAIVEAHGGELWADSDGESGAAFHFTLPLCDCKESG